MWGDKLQRKRERNMSSQAYSNNCNAFYNYLETNNQTLILISCLQAVRDGNKIWATIKSGTNQDGRTVTPITAPSAAQQVQLLEHTYSRFHQDKSHVQVIEAHGKINFSVSVLLTNHH